MSIRTLKLSIVKLRPGQASVDKPFVVPGLKASGVGRTGPGFTAPLMDASNTPASVRVGRDTTAEALRINMTVLLRMVSYRQNSIVSEYEVSSPVPLISRKPYIESRQRLADRRDTEPAATN